MAESPPHRCAYPDHLRPACLAVPADLQTRNQNAEVALLRYGFLQFFEELAFKLHHFAAAQAGHVQVVAARAALVEVALSLYVHKVELVDQALALQKADGAVYRDAVDIGIKTASFAQNLASVEMLLGGFDDAQDGAPLPGKPYAAIHELRL